MSKLTFQSTVTLSDGTSPQSILYSNVLSNKRPSVGAKLPVMGFGALGQGDAKTAIVEALKAGYKYVL